MQACSAIRNVKPFGFWLRFSHALACCCLARVRSKVLLTLVQQCCCLRHVLWAVAFPLWKNSFHSFMCASSDPVMGSARSSNLPDSLHALAFRGPTLASMAWRKGLVYDMLSLLLLLFVLMLLMVLLLLLSLLLALVLALVGSGHCVWVLVWGSWLWVGSG